MDTTTNVELEEIARKLTIPLLGIFSKDQLPKKKRAGGYIINLEDGDAGGGTHWTAFLITRQNKVFYFDSFGLPPPSEIKQFVKTKIGYSTRHIQDIMSNSCGYFCLYFLKDNPQTAEQFDDFLNSFRATQTQNERILEKYFK